jgi:hypothetical protein
VQLQFNSLIDAGLSEKEQSAEAKDGCESAHGTAAGLATILYVQAVLTATALLAKAVTSTTYCTLSSRQKAQLVLNADKIYNGAPHTHLLLRLLAQITLCVHCAH